MKFSLLTVGCCLLLSACGSFEFKTNLDPSNFREYYKPSQVTEMTEAQIEEYDYHSFGSVEGLSCQITERDAIATEERARTNAKLKAVDAGANAIVFGKCVKLQNTPACLVSVTCYADAIKLVQKRK